MHAFSRCAYIDSRACLCSCGWEFAQGGWTPLHDTVRNGQLECARLLLEHGADVGAKSQVRWPCHTTFGVDSVLQLLAALKHRIPSH